MPDLTSANYVFLPWVRQGLAADIPTPDMSASQRGFVAVPVRLRVNGGEPLERRVRLYGPGDIVGIDPQQVVRIEPRHLAADFEPNYFPAVEFDRPDFPWLFTPARAVEQGRLRPWLCLVVVRKQAGVQLRSGADLPLPVLTIEPPAVPADELPDLAEAWAWAHAQVVGSRRSAAALQAALAGDPALTVSRLLCPRRLDPLTDYLACVVPTFELGVRAGLGRPIMPADEAHLAPAWASGDAAPPDVTLPVYLHWEFRTGTGGDFEAMVRALEPVELPEEAGRLPVAIGDPGFVTSPPLPPGVTLALEGALRVRGSAATDWPPGAQGPFQDALGAILNRPWEVQTATGHEPLLAPPIYGRWHAARPTVERVPAPPAPPPAPPWLHELNLDPRHRAAAALGTRVVRAQQEQLMAAAWEQLGAIERVNQLLRQAQLARAVGGVYYARHFRGLPPAGLLSLVAPARARVVVEVPDPNGLTTRSLLTQRIARSALPERAISGPMRRFTNPRGPVRTRFQAPNAARAAMAATLNAPARQIALRAREAGPVTIDQVSERAPAPAAGLGELARFQRIGRALENAPPIANFTIAPEGTLRTLLSFRRGPPEPRTDAQAFLSAAREQHRYLIEQLFLTTKTFPAPLNLGQTRDALLRSVDPELTITTRVRASLRVDGGTPQRGDALEPRMDAPVFPQPMYEALRDLAPEYLFPGLAQILPNSVAVLETNPAFVEAFMVGLNAELGAELLWRTYPTDQRGTLFRQFWDGLEPDIDAIDTWGDRLGRHVGAGGQLVLLVRGELLRRYPGTVIYAVAAERRGGKLELSRDPGDELHPLFRGTIKPDVTFLGFALTREKARDDPGWFFVIQQQPTEPRFGLDAADFGKPLPDLATWDDLSWRHLAATPEELAALSHASARAALPAVGPETWGRNAAHQATITLQRPVRVAIHARELLS